MATWKRFAASSENCSNPPATDPRPLISRPLRIRQLLPTSSALMSAFRLSLRVGLALLPALACSSTRPLGTTNPEAEGRVPGGRDSSLAAHRLESAPVDLGSLKSLLGVPEDALGTQRILRLNYQDSDQDASLKLVLRLETARRFSIQGSDQFNRGWFRIAVEGEQAVVLDLRDKGYCVYRGEIELEQVPLGPLPFAALPALLLGRLPMIPRTAEVDEDGDWLVHDLAGRRWSARLEEGELRSWTLWDGVQPEVYWQRAGKMSLLSSRSRQLQMRWRTGKVEALSSPLGPFEPPKGFVEACPESGV